MKSLLPQMPVIPNIQPDDPVTSVKIAQALSQGGLKIVEVVLRTETALEGVKAISQEIPNITVGAGTVLNASQADAAINAGAKFIVSPGLDEETVLCAQDSQIPIFPGAITPTEIQKAVNLGLDIIKFFPCSLVGGAPMIKALSSVFRETMFIPTGGISRTNLPTYLKIPSVLACGGSWLAPQNLVEKEDYDGIAPLAAKALSTAQEVGA